MARILFMFIIHPSYERTLIESQDGEIKNIWEIVFELQFWSG